MPCAGYKAGPRSFTESGRQFICSQGVGHDLKGSQAPPNGSLSGDLGGGSGIAKRKVTQGYSVGLSCVHTPAVLENPWPDVEPSLVESLLPGAALPSFPGSRGLVHIGLLERCPRQCRVSGLYDTHHTTTLPVLMGSWVFTALHSQASSCFWSHSYALS